MKHNIIFFILLALVMNSCEYELNFSGEDRNPRLFVLGMPGASDTTLVRLHSTIPMGDRNSSPLPLDDARVSLVVNGGEVVMDRADESVPSLPEGSFYTLHPVLPGDKVEVMASAGGLEPVRAESSVPEAFPENEVVLTAEQWIKDNGSWTYVDNRLNFSVRFRDDSDDRDYYGIQVFRRKEHYHISYLEGTFEEKGYEYESVSPMNFNDEDDSGMELHPFRKPIVVNYSSGTGLYSKEKAPMVIYDDRTFENGEGVMEFLSKYESDKATMSRWEGDVLLEESGYRCSYKVVLYRISPELYRFIRSNEILDINLQILIAAAPPSYVYTNIRGGVGVFGGISKTETDWIPNVKLSNEQE